MKIILSRKGFDLSNGRMPSPIFPGGRVISFPIPTADSPTRIADLKCSGLNIADIISDLSNKRIQPQQHIHLDPDLNHDSLNRRHEDWRGAFGQTGTAQKHLSNLKVGKDDLFLFFGWFKEIEKDNTGWKFKKDSPDLHVIFGWLVIDEIISVYKNEDDILKKYPWLENHPHLSGFKDSRNTIYLGNRFLPPGLNEKKPGFGFFDKLRNIQILTDTSQKNRTVWKLPASFFPEDDKPALSYHGNKARWMKEDDNWVKLNSVCRGQEFVLDFEFYHGVEKWLIDLFN